MSVEPLRVSLFSEVWVGSEGKRIEDGPKDSLLARPRFNKRDGEGSWVLLEASAMPVSEGDGRLGERVLMAVRCSVV